MYSLLTIGFFPNETKDTDLNFTKMLIDFVVQKGCRALLYSEFEQYKDIQAQFCSEKVLLQESAFVVVLGGDGTILRYAEKTCVYQRDLLGINLGTLGYLTDVEKDGAIKALQNVLDKRFKVEKRMMLETDICGVNKIALNDIYISKGFYSKMAKLEIYINDEYIDTYCGDGIIFSTPTGSTGYNISAGGPILKPDAEMIAVTPICPHNLYARPFVISAHDVIRVTVCDHQNADVTLSADGERKAQIESGDSIVIKRSDFYTSIIRTTNLGFYDILRRKMVGTGREI